MRISPDQARSNKISPVIQIPLFIFAVRSESTLKLQSLSPTISFLSPVIKLEEQVSLQSLVSCMSLSLSDENPHQPPINESSLR